jgi:hypothetical protein
MERVERFAFVLVRREGGAMQSELWFSGNARLNRRYAPLLTFIALLAMGGSAAAQQNANGDADVLIPDLTPPRRSNDGPVNLLPEGLSARVAPDRATATTWAGYDGARRSPLVTAMLEARIIGRVVLVAGAGYTAEMPGAPGFRPQIGARAQFLDQAKHGIDAGAEVIYRQDVFTIEGGFFQGGVALERQQGRVHLLGNILYGQDGEGDDREGEARAATMVETARGLRVGLDGRYRHLWSTDPNRLLRDRPEWEIMAAPTASFSYGSWALMAEAGFNSVRTTVTNNGVIALGGLASTF